MQTMCTTDDTLINASEFTTVYIYIKGIVIDLLLIGVVNADDSKMTRVGGQGGQTDPPGETLITHGKHV